MMLKIKGKKFMMVGVGFLVVLAVVLFGLGGKKIDISNTGNPGNTELTENSEKKKSLIAGIECENYNARPVAVMMSSDEEARPLSGIGEAEMVFEMPVVDTGFTRMMAVYQCNQPPEIGSVRSSRMDFVPLALGLNAIYVHFGGEREVLQELRSGIIDNIDGLRYDGEYYYRKSGIKRPHNAFTTSDLLAKISSKLDYANNSDVSYPHSDGKSRGDISPPAIFNKEFEVIWGYNKGSNSYFRSRANRPEIDKNTNKQVEAKNVVVMKTTWTPINKDYIRVTTVGSGSATVYKNGKAIHGTWKKAHDKAKLYFYDKKNEEIKFVPGATWVEVVTN